MFINKKEDFFKELLLKGRISSFSKIEDRIISLKKIAIEIKKLSLESKNNELLAFFYFLEESIILLKNNSEKYFSDTLPRGIVLNIPSSNIPMMPFYTWVPSFLSGNKNFVRLSRKSDHTLISNIISLIDIALGKVESKKQIFYRGDIDSEITAEISLNCDVRMIWGNDSTIKEIKKAFPTSANIEINYQNRNSAALIDSNEYLKMSIVQKKIFLKKYLNDSLSFSFAACSSPQYTFWIGSKKINKDAQTIFIKDLKTHFNQNDIDKGIISTNNLNSFQSFLIDSNEKIFEQLFLLCGRGIALIDIKELINITDSFLNANSLFVSLENFEEFIRLFPKNIQTLTYSKQIDISFIEDLPRSLNYNCPDRIVPFGDALKFDMTWDGTNFFNVLRKKILIK